jgi:hypothetical protein
MIAEPVALQTPTHSSIAPTTCAPAIDAAPATGTPATAWRKRLSGAVAHTMIGLLRALAMSGNPPYFELERRGPVEQRLGPGLSRVSDSFWPISEW